MKSAFDAYGESYDDVMKKSIGFIGQKHDYYTQAKADILLDSLRRQYGATRQLSVLDVGCGIGKTDGFLSPDLGKLTGVDVSSASIERARRENPDVQYEVYDGRSLPFDNATFDAAFLICVLHHVAPEERVALLREVRRTVRPGGSVFIFEHNPFHPLTRLAVARCEFDRDAQLLSQRAAKGLLRDAGFWLMESQYILFLPFKSKVLRGTDFLRRNVPLGAQYFVTGVNHAE
ncbi:MAG TPA: class I SAM-dependent methyltransferase [Pontiellaceae bacterium]|nr:class I SAM-dependent methyltransferase [Pontiellaceae bacterium]